MRMPGLRLRIGLAVVVIAASAAWLMRPLDRSVLIPMSATPGGVEYLNLQGRAVREPRTPDNAERWNFATSNESLILHQHSEYSSPSFIPRVRGYADDNGQLKHRIAWEKLPPEFEFVPVRKGQLWGYMNRANQWVVEPKYTVAEVSHLSGIGVVWLGDRRGAVNRSGQLIVPCEHDSISSGSDRGFAYVKASVLVRETFAWSNWIKTWINQCFGTKLPILTSEFSVFDSQGNLIYRASWLFRSWASVWILLASAWIGIESVIWLIRRRHHKRPESPPPSEPPDLSSAAHTH